MRSEKEDKESLFSRGWHHIVEDLAKDALISGAEREALQCVPKTARRLPNECWPVNNEASGGAGVLGRGLSCTFEQDRWPTCLVLSTCLRPGAASSSAS